MEKLNNFVAELKKCSEAVERRQAAFCFVRDIPYATLGSHSIEDAIDRNRANCRAKTQLLKFLFEEVGYEMQILVMQYRLKDYPSEVKFIPKQLDYHYVPQILLQGKWISVDATYDPPLAALGFVVNEWDGRRSTPIAEKALSQKIEGQPDVTFDRGRQEFEAALNKAYQQYQDKIKSYQVKFNEWLLSARS